MQNTSNHINTFCILLSLVPLNIPENELTFRRIGLEICFKSSNRMFVVNHKIARWTSKVMLTVICFSLLAAEGSPQFYQFANSPSRHLSICGASDGQLTERHSGDIHREPSGLDSHSLDKRFDLSHLFVLPLFVTGISPSGGEWLSFNLFVLTGLKSQTKFRALLRGPPLQLS